MLHLYWQNNLCVTVTLQQIWRQLACLFPIWHSHTWSVVHTRGVSQPRHNYCSGWEHSLHSWSYFNYYLQSQVFSSYCWILGFCNMGSSLEPELTSSSRPEQVLQLSFWNYWVNLLLWWVLFGMRWGRLGGICWKCLDKLVNLLGRSFPWRKWLRKLPRDYRARINSEFKSLAISSHWTSLTWCLAL